MKAEALLISAVIKAGTTKHLKRDGVSPELFTTYHEEAEWLLKQPSVPSKSVFLAKFSDFRWRNNVKSDDIPTLIGQLKQGYQQTQLQKVIEQAAKQLKNGTPEEVATMLRERTIRLLETSGIGVVEELVTTDKKFLKEFKKRQENQDAGIIAGIPTGSPTIDNHTGGLQKAQLYIAIARQGNAKTYWMLRAVAEALRAGKRVLWVSREMPEEMVRMRLYSILSTMYRGEGKSFSNLSLILGRKDVDYKELSKFLKDIRKAIKGRLYIPDDRRLGIDHLSPYLERYAPDLVVYDYLGILSKGEGERSWQKIGEQANALKDLAMEYDCAVLCAAQVNRQAAELEDEAPMVENISFSDSIGYAADMVFSLVISGSDPSNPYGDRTLEIWMRKARYGAKDAMVTLRFNGDRGVLEELESPLASMQKFRDKKKKRKKAKEEEKTKTKSIAKKKSKKAA